MYSILGEETIASESDSYEWLPFRHWSELEMLLAVSYEYVKSCDIGESSEEYWDGTIEGTLSCDMWPMSKVVPNAEPGAEEEHDEGAGVGKAPWYESNDVAREFGSDIPCPWKRGPARDTSFSGRACENSALSCHFGS